jgi:hypothetical protein
VEAAKVHGFRKHIGGISVGTEVVHRVVQWATVIMVAATDTHGANRRMALAHQVNVLLNVPAMLLTTFRCAPV